VCGLSSRLATDVPLAELLSRSENMLASSRKNR
jgi:hypothetical protein